MPRKHKNIGGFIGADPLPSGSPRPGVSNLGSLGGDGASSGDANWNDVTLLLDGSSATDDVANDQVFETVSNVTAQSTGGPNSNGPVLDFGSSGSTGYILDDNPTSLPQGTEDFTVEFWFRRDYVNNSAARTLFAGINGTADRQLDVYLTADSKVNYFHTSANKITGTTTLGYQTWHHIATVRNAGTTTLFVDGVSQGSFSDTGSYTTGTKLALGGYYGGTSWVTGGNSLQGQITDVRVTRGVARDVAADWTAGEYNSVLPQGPIVAATTKPTRRWGGITGRSLVDNNALPTTGVLSLAEHYQSKL